MAGGSSSRDLVPDFGSTESMEYSWKSGQTAIPVQWTIPSRFPSDTSESEIAEFVVPPEIRQVLFRGKAGIGLREHLVPAGEESLQILFDNSDHAFSDTDHAFWIRRSNHLFRVQLP